MRLAMLAIGWVVLLLGPSQAALLAAWEAAGLGAERWRPVAGQQTASVRALQLATVEGRQVVRATAATAGGTVAGPLGNGAVALSLVAVVVVERLHGEWQGIVTRDRSGGATGDVFGLLLDPQGRWAARLVTTAGSCSLTAPASLGWHQIALTYDGQALRLLVDGQPAGEAPARGAVVSAETPLALGSYAEGVTPFLGGLARAELHDEALTAEALASAWQRWQAEHPLADHFSFAQASDLHVTDTRSVELINDAVDQINADPRVAFSLWLGDLTRQSEPDEMLLARLALKRLVRPWYVLRGNHDQYGGSFEAVFGATHQVVRYAGWVFLLADTNPGDEVPMAASQQTWLKEQLAGLDRTTPVVLATHHPLMPQTRSYLLAGAAEVLGLFGGHNLKAALAGHFHGNQEQRANGVLFTTTACLSSTRTNHDGGKARGYRLFHCRDGQISTEFVPVAEL